MRHFAAAVLLLALTPLAFAQNPSNPFCPVIAWTNETTWGYNSNQLIAWGHCLGPDCPFGLDIGAVASITNACSEPADVWMQSDRLYWPSEGVVVLFNVTGRNSGINYHWGGRGAYCASRDMWFFRDEFNDCIECDGTEYQYSSDGGDEGQRYAQAEATQKCAKSCAVSEAEASIHAWDYCAYSWWEFHTTRAWAYTSTGPGSAGAFGEAQTEYMFMPYCYGSVTRRCDGYWNNNAQSCGCPNSW